jgi:hypothetical protein
LPPESSAPFPATLAASLAAVLLLVTIFAAADVTKANGLRNKIYFLLVHQTRIETPPTVCADADPSV